MSQASSINTENNQGIRLPIDGLIEAVAERVGGDKKKEVVRFLKFGFVGTLGAILDLGVLNILLATVLPPTDAITGDIILINTIIATTISFTVAITSNFLWNRYWTYPDSRSRPLMKQLLLFAFICTVGWIGRSIWIAFATEPLKDFVIANSSFSIDLAGRLGASLATFFGIFVVMIWNFFVNRYWTFNDVD